MKMHAKAKSLKARIKELTGKMTPNIQLELLQESLHQLATEADKVICDKGPCNFVFGDVTIVVIKNDKRCFVVSSCGDYRLDETIPENYRTKLLL